MPLWLELSLSNDVLALAPGAGNRRTGAQNSFDDLGSMGTKRNLFDEKTGRSGTNAELSERAKYTREYVLRQFGQPFVDDRIDLENANQTKAELSSPMALMDKIGGWDEETLGTIQIRGKHVTRKH